MDSNIKQEPSPIVVGGYEMVGNMEPQEPSTSFHHPYGYGYHNSSSEPPESRYTYLATEDLYQFDEMQRLLKEWGLEALSERFVQNLIDVSVLEYIVEMDIIDLCKDFPIRFRVILRHKLGQQKYKPSHVAEPTIATNNTQSNTVPERSYNAAANNSKCDQETSQKSQTSSLTPATEIMDGPSSNPTEIPQQLLLTGQFKLVDLLQQYESGRAFLEQYKIENGKRIYSADSRNHIKKALIDHYFRLGRGHISMHQFREMVQLIVEELPDEDPHIWYSMPPAESSLSARGLLYTRYRYISQKDKLYKKQKDEVQKVVPHSKVLAQQAKDAWEALNGIDQAACLVAKSKLKAIENVEAEDIANAWKESYPLRRYEATMGVLQLNDFQPLTKFEGVHDLITQDFCLVHSIASESFYERVPHFVERFKTVYLGYKALIEEDKVLPTAIISAFMEHKGLTEKMIFLAFYSLPHILRQNFLGSKGRKRRKLSTMQARLSFITLLSAEYMLLECVTDRKRTAAENDNPNRPFIIAIGSLAGDIRSLYVVLDELIFPCKTTVQAVDLLFKLYTVFHMDYAQECGCVLQFIQGYLYNLKFQGDRINTLAMALITDFNRL